MGGSDGLDHKAMLAGRHALFVVDRDEKAIVFCSIERAVLCIRCRRNLDEVPALL